MMQEKQPMRYKLTIIKVGERQDVPNKSYQKLEFDATTEKSGDKPYTFTTFKRNVMDAVEKSVGKTIDADVITDERKVTDVYQNGQSTQTVRDTNIKAQEAVKSVVALLNTGVYPVPQDIKDMTEEWIRKSLKEGLE